MKETIRDASEIVSYEYSRAKNVCGKHHPTDHHAYSVILEELNEFNKEREKLETAINDFWECCQCDETKKSKLEMIEKAYTLGILAIAELTQTVAMLHKEAETLNARLKGEPLDFNLEVMNK